MSNKAQKPKRENVVDKYSKGATYIPFKSEIDYQENSRYWTFSLRYLDHNNEDGIIIKFNRYIPLYIYPCQILSKHGTQVALIPQCSGVYDKKIIWQISSILTQVDKTWKLFDNAMKNHQYWFVYILTYLTRCCFSSQRRQRRKYLFNNKYVISGVNIRNQITDCITLPGY